MFTGLHHELEEVIDVGHGATVTVQRTQGRTRHMKLETNLRWWAAVWTFRAGKVVRAQGCMHRLEALEAAGLSE